MQELDAFETDVLSHLDALHGVACRLTRNPSSAEDLVQDAVVKALRARDQFKPGTNLRAWLMRILTNTFINQYRRAGLERETAQNAEGDAVADGWISTATMRQLRSPEEVALLPLIEGELSRALDELPVEYRMAVLLCDVEELSYEEAAASMGCPIGTVMSRLHRGRKALKSRLADHAEALGLLPAAANHEGAVDLNAYRKRVAGGRG